MKWSSLSQMIVTGWGVRLKKMPGSGQEKRRYGSRQGDGRKTYPSSNVVTPNISSSGSGTGSWVE